MDSEQVNDVIDKLAETMGATKDSVMPLVEQMAAEYWRVHVAGAIFCLVGMALLAGYSVYALKHIKAREDESKRRSDEKVKAKRAAGETYISPFDRHDSDDFNFARLLAVILPDAIFGLILIGLLHASVVRVVAPTYYFALDMLAAMSRNT